MQQQGLGKLAGVASTLIVAVLSCATQSRAATPVYVLLPKSTTISGAHSTQQLLVERLMDQRFAGDKTGAAKLKSSNPAIASVDEKGIVHPAGNGDATITATVEGESASAAIKVTGMGRDVPRSFRNEV